MIDRKNIPPHTSISNISYILPEKWKLTNGMKVWGLNAGSQELVKIEFVFNAGTWYQPANLVAGFTNLFMNQGTQKYTAQQIAQIFDFCGAYLQLAADQQFGTLTILTLNKYLDTILEVTADVIKNPVFPEKEIKTQIAKKKQQFIIENKKPKTLAQKRFSQVLFGAHHPYANSNNLADYELLNREQFVDYHQKHYNPNNCFVIVSGLYNGHLKELLEKHFGSSFNPAINKVIHKKHVIKGHDEKVHFIEKKGALQSSIRLGCLFPNRNHADFYGLSVLTTILGGYFGSRLMTNIREDKGYTYGIGAGVFSMLHSAYFLVMTEVGAKVCDDALEQIFYEIERLQNEPVSEDELGIVRSFLLSETLRSFDGIFAMSNSLKTLVEWDFDYDYYDKFVDTVRAISPEELQHLAKEYLNVSDMYRVVAGSKNS